LPDTAQEIIYLIGLEERNMFAITRKGFYCALAMLVFTVATPAARAATPLTQVQLATELMIENQGDNAGFLGLMFGPDASSPLNFSSNVNSAGTMFSFSTDPGATYQGQSLVLSGLGVFNPSTNVLVTSSSGSLGGESWTTSGYETVTAIGDGFSTTSDSDLFAQQVKAFDRHRVTDLFPDGKSTDFGWFTDKNGNKIPNSDFTSTDTWKLTDPNPGTWQYAESGLTFAVTSQGFSPLTGGTGSFVASVVPEPSASLLFLGGLSMLWLAFARRRFFGGGGGNGMQVSAA
jgi:hypothetical protein